MTSRDSDVHDGFQVSNVVGLYILLCQGKLKSESKAWLLRKKISKSPTIKSID